MNQVGATALELTIARTLAWFSLFDYPLTSFDLWKYLYQPDKKYSLIEVETVLFESRWLAEKIKISGGFYFWFEGKDDTLMIKITQARFLDATRKYKKLRWAVRYFSLFPFIRAVFACNNLPWHNTSAGSDIDLFIVVEPGTIWLSRLLLVLPFALFKKRPIQNSTTPPLSPSFGLPPPLKLWRTGRGASHHSTTFDPFCFSFFTTEDNLNFEKLLLQDEDPYFSYWLASLVPVLDRDNLQERLWSENKWLVETLPNIFLSTKHNEISPQILPALPLNFLKFFEAPVRWLQYKFLPCELRDAANRNSCVIVSEQMLKFHTNDRRERFRDEWQKILVKHL